MATTLRPSAIEAKPGYSLAKAKPWTAFPGVPVGIRKGRPHGSILDGELVALDPSGRPSFGRIQNSATSGPTFVFFAFDLLRLERADLTQSPLPSLHALLRTSLRLTASVQLSELQHPPPSKCWSWFGIMVSGELWPNAFRAVTSRECLRDSRSAPLRHLISSGALLGLSVLQPQYIFGQDGQGVPLEPRGHAARQAWQPRLWRLLRPYQLQGFRLHSVRAPDVQCRRSP